MYKLAYAAGFKKGGNLKKEAGDEVTNEARLARSFFKVSPRNVCGLLRHTAQTNFQP